METYPDVYSTRIELMISAIITAQVYCVASASEV